MPAMPRITSYNVCYTKLLRIGVFRIVSESAVSSGVRRIEALTGEAARQWLVGREEALKAVAGTLKSAPEEVVV